MVNTTSLQFSFLSILLLLSNISLASPQLLLFSDKTESELGRPIRVELIAVSVKEKLSEINLEPLTEHFGVITDYFTADTQDSRWPKQTLQVLNLKLYPRQAGNIVIPSLSLGKFTSKETIVNVSSGENGTPQIKLSARSPYERQQFTVQVTVQSTQLSARLSISVNEKIKGFESTPLSFKRLKQKDGRYLLQIGWALSALNKNIQRIELPAIEYSVSGVLRKRFYLPVQEIKVKQLPAYLPPTIPVGKVLLSSKLSKTGLFKTDSIIYWHLQLKGNVGNSYQLPPVLRQIKSNDTIKFFPVNSKRSRIISEGNSTSTVTHIIPLKVLTSGAIKLPEINTQYFDPANGKLIKTTLATTSVFALSVFWQAFILIAVIIATVYLFKILFKTGQRIHYSKQQRKLALNLLQTNPKITEIRAALKLLAKAEYWTENMSLTQWSKSWSNKYKTDVTFNPLINNISQACYSEGDIYKEDLSGIVNEIINIIEKRNKTYSNTNKPLFNL